MPTEGICQNKQEDYKKFLELLEKGDKSYKKGNYEDALSLYLESTTFVEGDQDADKRLGITYCKLKQYDEALPVLQKLKNSIDSVDIFIEYFLAVTLHNLNRYSEAVYLYSNCLKYIKDHKVESGWEDINTLISICNFWKNLSDNPLDVIIVPLDSVINTKFSEYGCKITPDGSRMYFTTRRKNGPLVADLILKPDEDIYISDFINNHWNSPEKPDVLNLSTNNAVLDLSDDGTILYLYSNLNEGDILEADLSQDSVIISSLKGDINTPGFSESAFTILKDGKTAFYSSNRTDIKNFGGKDIFMAVLDSSGVWRTIKNLGESINTEYDEDFVFWCDEDTSLYFSSNSERSVGGLDIFVCRSSIDGKLMPPENIGLPINTPYNDISFFKSGDIGWYATTNEGFEEDIFEIHFVKEIKNPVWQEIQVHDILPIDSFVLVNNLLYNTGQSSVDKNDARFKQLKNVLENSGLSKIRLSGYADWQGETKRNNKLAFDRAMKLADLLINQGINPKKLIIDSYGEIPIVPVDSLEDERLRIKAMQWNRSVQLSVDQQGSPYIFVETPEEYMELISYGKMDKKTFGVMVYVSEYPVKMFKNNNMIKEAVDPTKTYYYYYAGPYFHPADAKEQLDMLASKYLNAYIFENTDSTRIRQKKL